MSGTQKQFSRMTTIEKNKIEINSQKQMRNEVEGEGEEGRHYGVVRRFGRSLPIANKKKSCTIPKATTARGRRRGRGGGRGKSILHSWSDRHKRAAIVFHLILNRIA